MPSFLGFKAPQVRGEIVANPIRSLVKRREDIGGSQLLEEHRLLVQIERVKLRVTELVMRL